MSERNQDESSDEVVDARVGTQVDGYLIEKRMGAGAMGVVYRAADRDLGRSVAIKFLGDTFVHDRSAREKFEKEAKRAAGVAHPNIVPIYGIGVDDHRWPYIAMECIDGPDLKSLIKKEGALPESRALSLFEGIARALQAVHDEGMVHRDVKPDNVLVRNVDEDGEQALLTDFGLAVIVDSATIHTEGLGTLDYMAPEVVNQESASHLSDQYSLAVVLYELLAGLPVFHDQPVPAAHLDAPLPDFEQTLPNTSFAVRAALERALAKDAGERFPSVGAFAKATRKFAEGGLPALQSEMTEFLSAKGPLGPKVLAKLVNERRPNGPFVTPIQVEGRARLFPQMFRRKADGSIENRDG